MDKVFSSYIHIPFCKTICSYCDFCKMYYNEDLLDKYLNSLKKEIDSNYKNEILKTIYIGGGTPSCLNEKELNKLFEIIKTFKTSKDIEFTFEVNINDINRELLIILKENKVNRLSIGVESINEKFLNFLNRKHTKEEVIEKINLTKEYFKNISVDLMYAFSNQTLEDLKKDLEFIKSINVSHISIYSLIIEKHTKLYIDKVLPLNEEIEESMYYYIIKYLNTLGYSHYEISNFSKKGYESKHNLTYWNNEEYYGFGLGASGYIGNKRYTNTRSINKYVSNDYLSEIETIDKKIDMENYMILGLRKINGVSKDDFLFKYNLNIYEAFDIIELIDRKLLIDDGKNIYIPSNKLYIQNSILVNFIGGSNGSNK